MNDDDYSDDDCDLKLVVPPNFKPNRFSFHSLRMVQAFFPTANRKSQKAKKKKTIEPVKVHDLRIEEPSRNVTDKFD